MKYQLAIWIGLVCAAPIMVASANPNTGSQKPPQAAVTAKKGDTPAPAGSVAPDVKYPYSYQCTHCGMTITAKSAKDLSEVCQMCACGASQKDCQPKKK